RALFDGMGSYLRANGVERVVDQTAFPDDAFRTAWGVADEELFRHSLVELDTLHASGDPFYALVLTVSNHRPYRFPQEHVQYDRGMDRRHNAVRYADWALGEFIRQARQHPFFDDTLFVLMGDHGARVYGAAEIPLPSYHVPILFLAPGSVEPGRVETLASSLDVPATVLARLGIAAPSHFFGRPLLADAPGGRALMTHNNEVALLEGREMAVLGLHGRTESFSCTDSLSACAGELGAGREADRLVDDAIAYYEGADLLYRSGELAAPEAAGPRVASAADVAASPVARSDAR
ncbi:MAG: LTA synthase family protein, partial [Acidobacteria bacterium]|nr:LTA synthase family protein [Acidobacteriota bacterium]